MDIILCITDFVADCFTMCFASHLPTSYQCFLMLILYLTFRVVIEFYKEYKGD